jgi:TrmH family RNA methyltransferase
VASSKLTHVTSRDNPLLVRLRKLASGEAALGQLLLTSTSAETGWRAAARRPQLAERLAAGACRGRSGPAVVVADAAMAELSSLDTPAPVARRAGVAADPCAERRSTRQAATSATPRPSFQPGDHNQHHRSWVLRAGMGAHFTLDLIENRQAEALAALTPPLIGTSSHAEESIADAVLDWPCAWVFGNEGAGAGAAVQQRCARMVRIPQPGGEESLNVGAAAAICLWESARARR